MKLSFIARKQIKVGDRFRKDYGDLSALIISIETVEIIQPIAVKEIGKNKYRLVAGGRRVQAFDELKMDEIPCRIYEKDVDDSVIMLAELEENTRRKELTSQEELENVLAIHEAMEKKYGKKKNQTDPNDPGWNVAKTAKYLGKDRGNVVREINAARAAQVFPEINQAKTKEEAFKIYKGIKGKHERLIRADEIRETIKDRPEDIRKKELIDSFIIHDIKKGLPIPDMCADFVELDPPYAINLNKIKDLRSTPSQIEQKEYTEIGEEEYMTFLPTLIKECYRVLKKDRWMVLWFGIKPWCAYESEVVINKKKVMVKRNFIVEWLEDAGFTVNFIPDIWVKIGGTFQSRAIKVNRPYAYEPFLAARKGMAFLNKEARLNTYHYERIPPQRKVHSTERPISMMTDIISTYVPEGSHVVVPCCGSGNTMLGANNHLCSSVGFEINKSMKDDFVIKVEEGKLEDFMSPVLEKK